MEETHYLSYDPEEMFDAMQDTYARESGEVLWPGDEKEMLLRAVESILMQAMAGVDHALRMATLRYATGDYLDLYGENRGCIRNEAQRARATVEITAKKTGEAKTIPAGTALTADGEQVYLLEEDLVLTGQAMTARVGIVAEQEGEAGNGLTKGTQMQLLAGRGDIGSIICTKGASGGQQRETDDSYRERIRTYGLASTTTGPAERYEAAAKAVSSQIQDARAVNQGPGKVGVALLLEKGAEEENLLEDVKRALNDQTVRPLTDQVDTFYSLAKTYTLELNYQAQERENIATAVAAAVNEYQQWQEETIGRAFNPDRLLAAVYQAGAIRVSWGAGSQFDGDKNIGYREIGNTEHCAGEITLGVIR